jgi:hypothetical protein
LAYVAIRELLKRGLGAEGFEIADGGARSRDFGVTGQSSACRRDPEDQGNRLSGLISGQYSF